MLIVWWHWVIAGLCLICLELIIPSFTIIWFGLGALLVATISGIWPTLPLAGQVALWSMSSISFTAMWFKYLKPKGIWSRAGMLKEDVVGETGIVIRGTVDSYSKGIVKFRISMLGADEWSCYAEELLHVGDRVRVTDIEGQSLKVEII